MMPPDDHWLARAHAAARTRYGNAFKSELLPPYGSLRRYVRIIHPNGSDMLMLLPDPQASATDAGTSYNHAPQDDPFIAVARWLETANVRVPRIHGTDSEQRGIWIEDLGAFHLQDALLTGKISRTAAYQGALRLLHDFQQAPDASPPPPFTQNKALDHDLLLWELEHYVEWRLERSLNIQLDPSERAELQQTFLWITRQLTALPQTTVHRDFQSHNIMMLPHEEFAIIDFQDCLQGPIPYDAVALLRDSYIVLPPDEFKAHVTTWARTTLPTLPAFEGGSDELTQAFHLQTIQRKLKDSGRFELFAIQQGKTRYLDYLPASIGYVRDAIQALGYPEELDALHRVLSRSEPLYT